MNSFWLKGVRPKPNMTNILIRNRIDDTGRKEGHVKTEPEIGVMLTDPRS